MGLEKTLLSVGNFEQFFKSSAATEAQLSFNSRGRERELSDEYLPRRTQSLTCLQCSTRRE